MAYKSGNPALNKKTFEDLETGHDSVAMTLNGVAAKSFMMLILCIGAGAFGWQFADRNSSLVPMLLFGSIITALVIALITIFKKTASPITAPLYAVVEGFALGIISQTFDKAYDGIVVQAILITVCIFAAMLIIYLLGIINVTENFRLGIASATLGVVLFYGVSLILGLFGVNISIINSSSPFGIVFSLVVVTIAALNLVVDFDFIERGVDAKAPKYMEWYSSFGLFVTLVWLYIEILRLLAKARR